MSKHVPEDWRDLSSVWREDAAGVNAEEIDRYLARERRQLWLSSGGEIAGLGIGFAAAVWTAVYAPYRGVGIVLALFTLAAAAMSWRLRRAPMPAGAATLAMSLKDSIAREDWLAEQLRLGRALSFVALFAIVMATSLQLFRLKAFSAAGLAAAGIGCTVVLAALAWNLVLTRRARRRRARLQFLDDRLNDRQKA